jgi:hypothetical protein
MARAAAASWQLPDEPQRLWNPVVDRNVEVALAAQRSRAELNRTGTESLSLSLSLWEEILCICQQNERGNPHALRWSAEPLTTFSLHHILSVLASDDDIVNSYTEHECLLLSFLSSFSAATYYYSALQRVKCCHKICDASNGRLTSNVL